MSTRGEALARFGLRRPVSVWMGLIAVILVGFVAWRSIALELVPSGFTPPFLYVQIPTLRASPADIERRIAIPAEELLSTVRNLDRMGTRIRPSSAGFMLEFADGTDMDGAYAQVRDRIERLAPTLGDDVGQYFIWKYNPSDDPVAWMAVSVGDDVDDGETVIDRQVRPRLERLPGVSRVEIFGDANRVVSVRIDDRGAEAAGSSVLELVTELTRDNFAMPAGTIEEAGSVYPIRVSERWESTDAIRALPVGNGLTIDDIGDVVIDDRSERAVYRVNGRESVFVAIYRESTANTVDVSRAIRDEINTRMSADPRFAGVEFHWFFDQGEVIEGALGNLQTSIIQGAFFAVLVLAWFLRNTRMTLVVMTAIPGSMLATLALLYFTGRTLNVLSLTGLMLAVGMVVDNAIVVVEAIQRRRASGQPAQRAALRGTASVALALVAATATTVAAFVPIMLMSGSETLSFYLGQIGLPVCAALIASLVMAIVFVPLVSAWAIDAKPPRPIASLDRLEARYADFLRRAIERRGDTLFVTLLLLASTAWPISQVKSTDESEPNINDVRIFLDLPDTFTFSERRDVLLGYESRLIALREELGIRDVMTRLGGWTEGEVRSFLVDADEREMSRDEVIERIEAALPEVAGVSHSLTWRGSGGAQRAVTVNIVGPDSGRLAELGEEVARRLRFIEGVRSVDLVSGEESQPELRWVVDRDRAHAAGLSPLVVGSTIDFTLRGRTLPGMRDGAGELPVVVEGNAANSASRATLSAIELPAMVPGVTLGAVASAVEQSGFQSIDRENRRTVLSLEIATTNDELETLSDEVDRALEGFAWPRGYSLEKGDRFAALREGSRDRYFALTLSIVFVFVLMGILLESFVLPLAIIVTVPLALTGVYWALYLTGTSLDVMAGVGLVILVGIVVNNGIVLIDVVGEMRRGGLSRTDALVEAGRERLRPILMTALTTIFGLIPMAIGSAALIGIPYSPLGRSVMGGMIVSTILTLVVIPATYTYLDDLGQWAASLRKIGRRRPDETKIVASSTE